MVTFIKVRIITFCAKYNLFATQPILEEKKTKECLFDYANKHNGPFFKIDTVQRHDLSMSGRITELASKYFLVHR